MESKPKDRIPDGPLDQSVPQGTIYLRAHEAARYCRCGKRRLFSWEDRGLLEAVADLDGRRFYRLGDLDEAMVGGPAPVVSNEIRRRMPALKPQYPGSLAELPYTAPRTRSSRSEADRQMGGG